MGKNTQDIVSKALFEKLGKRVSFVNVRCVGRKKSGTNRRILIRPKNYCDKDNLLSSVGNSPHVFENFTAKHKHEIEKVYILHEKNSECEYAWRIGQVSVISQCAGSWHKVLVMIIQWNEYYVTEYLSPFKCRRNSPMGTKYTVYTDLKCFLRHIIKIHKLSVENSTRFWKCVLTTNIFRNGKALYPRHHVLQRSALSIDCKLPVYINQIGNPDIRLIYTWLRSDLNILST